jgi:hypothetical protein
MKRILTLVVATSLGFAGNLFADPGQDARIQQALLTVPAAEMPAKAAGLIKVAKVRESATVTVTVVTAAVALNPPGAPTVVSSIAKSVPDMASIAAGTAAELQPKQACDIARAAAAAAPGKAGKIVAAVCRAVPQDYKKIAVAAAQAAPSAGKEILLALETALPDLKIGIETALAGYGNNPPSVSAVLDSAQPETGRMLTKVAAGSVGAPVGGPLQGAGPPPIHGPTLAPPFVPISGTSTNINPATSGNVPRGGRDYAAP